MPEIHTVLYKHALVFFSAAPRQEGPRLCFGEVGQRPPPHGQAGAGTDPAGPLVRRPGERLRPAPGRPVRPGHEASPHPAGAGAGEGEHKAQRQRTHVGRGGGVHQMKTHPRPNGLEDLAMVCVI